MVSLPDIDAASTRYFNYFASVETLGDVKISEVIGTLIVDEAGQAEPQAALGIISQQKASCGRDPNQIEPIVSDELNLLKKTFKDQDLKPYIWNKLSSVQTFADQMNPFGTYQEHIERWGRAAIGSGVHCLSIAAAYHQCLIFQSYIL